MTDFFMYQYGSTKQQLQERYWGYKGDSKRHTSPCHKYFNSVGWDKVNIILIEEGEYEDTKALRKREGEIIALHHGMEYCLNVLINNRTQKEYIKANAEKLKANAKVYREAHKKECNLASQKWHADNPEKSKQLHALRRKKCKELIKVQQKAYREANRDSHLAYMKNYNATRHRKD